VLIQQVLNRLGMGSLPVCTLREQSRGYLSRVERASMNLRYHRGEFNEQV